MAGEIHSAVEGMVVTNREIVRKLWDVIRSGTQCSCPCHTVDLSTDDDRKLQELEDKTDENEILVRSYLDKQTEVENDIEKLQTQNRDLEAKLEELKELVSRDNRLPNQVEGQIIPVTCASESGQDAENTLVVYSDEEALRNTSSPSGSPIRKPNFQRGPLELQAGPETSTSTQIAKLPDQTVKHIHQRDVTFAISDNEWTTKERRERHKALAHNGGDESLLCVATAICVDISASMLDNGAWNQAHHFIMEYIAGLEMMKTDYGIQEEYVALVTFGYRTEVVQHLTDDFEKIKTAFHEVTVGGPSSMYGGLKMADACFQITDTFYDVSGIQIYDKIVLVTDGYPTDTCKIGGPDTVIDPDDPLREEKILNLCTGIRNQGLDLFCVPCGRSNMEFLARMVETSNGKMVKHTEGKWLSKRTYMTIEAAKHQFDLTLTLSPQKQPDQAKREMLEILQKSRNKCNEMAAKLEQDRYRDTNAPNLPPVGSRVRRGPDWDRGNIDGNGPGTVTGHSEREGVIWVKWDAPGTGLCQIRYGLEMKYEVLIVDEYNRLGEPSAIGVGCEVVPGPQWRSMNTNVERGMSGVCIKLDVMNAVVQVKWKNGERGVYSCQLGRQEVILADRAPGRSHETVEDMVPRSTDNGRRAQRNTGGAVTPVTGRGPRGAPVTRSTGSKDGPVRNTGSAVPEVSQRSTGTKSEAQINTGYDIPEVVQRRNTGGAGTPVVGRSTGRPLTRIGDTTRGAGMGSASGQMGKPNKNKNVFIRKPPTS